MIPDYQTVMLPLLRLLSDDVELPLSEAISTLTAEFALTPEEAQQLLPSGRGTRIRSRVGWARTYLHKAALVDLPRRGYLRTTERGKRVIASNPDRVDVRFLRRFPEFMEFEALSRGKRAEIIHATDTATPEEALETAYDRLRVNLESELLQRVKTASPGFFERLVVELLVRMGYGGSMSDAGKAVGRSGDGGIDGIIKEDRLGLDFIYVQAKRWEGQVSRPDVQKFAGALQAHRARKGVFLTTSSFSKDAREFVDRIESKIVLVDGIALAKLMLDHNVGVSVTGAYEIKKIDSDYFAEE